MQLNPLNWLKDVRRQKEIKKELRQQNKEEDALYLARLKNSSGSIQQVWYKSNNQTAEGTLTNQEIDQLIKAEIKRRTGNAE